MGASTASLAPSPEFRPVHCEVVRVDYRGDPRRERGTPTARAVAATIVATSILTVAGVVLAGTLQYRSTATGNQEVPANNSSAEADLKVKVGPDGQRVTYDLKITELITGAFMAHLRRGIVGVNGGIAVWLYPGTAPATGAPLGTFDGRLAKGTILPKDLCYSPTAPFYDSGTPNWTGFLTALNAGGLYVNVDTLQDHPGGEIRGQVRVHPLVG